MGNSTFETKTLSGEKGGSPDVHLNRIVGNPQLSEQSNATSPILDQYLVTWEGPNDVANPKNWTPRRKFSSVSTVIVAPALITLAPDLHIHGSFLASFTVSIFILAYGFGPFLIGPLSEVYGRMLVLQVANIFYLAFNTACGFSRSTRQLIAFRFLAGIGGRKVLQSPIILMSVPAS